MIKKIYQIVVLMILIVAQPATAQESWVLEGLEMPESVPGACPGESDANEWGFTMT